MDIEQRLRESLAPRVAPPDLEAAVLARLSGAAPATRVSPRRASAWRVPAALAATVLATAIGLNWHMEQQRLRHDRTQLALALEITSSTLNEVLRRLSSTEPDLSGGDGT